MRFSYYKQIIIMCAVIFLSLIRSTEGYEVFTYDDPDGLTDLWTDSIFNDGTIILNFIKRLNATCMEPTFYYRIIHLNGTIFPLTINIPNIEKFNFCVVNYKTIYDTYILTSDYFLITYLESQRIGNKTYYQRVGNLVDLHGQIINKVNLSEPIDIQTDFGITININPEEGFIVTKITDNVQEYIQEWVTYKAP